MFKYPYRLRMYKDLSQSVTNNMYLLVEFGVLCGGEDWGEGRSTSCLGVAIALIGLSQSALS